MLLRDEQSTESTGKDKAKAKDKTSKKDKKTPAPKKFDTASKKKAHTEVMKRLRSVQDALKISEAELISAKQDPSKRLATLPSALTMAQLLQTAPTQTIKAAHCFRAATYCTPAHRRLFSRQTL